MNTFGTKLRLAIWGESHGPALGIVIDGVPAGIALAEGDFATDIERRKGGKPATTPRTESDTPTLLSGIYKGRTTGAPISILFRNENQRSTDYDTLAATPRPGHADWVAAHKFEGYNDPRGGGHFSGRLTLPIVAAGVVAKKVLEHKGLSIDICARIVELGGECNSEAWPELLARTAAEGDSLGAIVECVAEGVPAGLGEPFFDSLESRLAHILFAIPGVRGVEFGEGFEAARKRGSDHNDSIISPDGTTATNHSGGINGGLSNGNPLKFRVAFKPTSSIARTQHSLNLATAQVEPMQVGGRHDVCFALRTPVVVEAAAAIVLADGVL
ncbi:MAG: chorismate synthase [Tidjanibacter sp.]|nr:chorismate synthase [Tidjanibacter sp.]